MYDDFGPDEPTGGATTSTTVRVCTYKVHTVLDGGLWNRFEVYCGVENRNAAQ